MVSIFRGSLAAQATAALHEMTFPTVSDMAVGLEGWD